MCQFAVNDITQFRVAVGGKSQTFDFDNDGAFASDFIQFRMRFGGSI